MHPWSPAVYALWGKSGPPPLPLVEHLLDTAAVAGLLWDTFLPERLRAFLQERLDADEHDVRSLACFLAETHDIGKATPVFQGKVPALAAALEDFGLSTWTPRPGAEQERAHHATTGEYVMRSYLSDRGACPTWGNVTGSHHGRGQHKTHLVSVGHLGGMRSHEKRLMGGEGWSALRGEIFERAWIEHQMDANVSITRTPDLAVISAMTGIIILADWLASDENHFTGVDLGDPQRREQGLARIPLPDTWDPEPSPTYQDRFGEDFLPYPHQEQIAAICQQTEEPSLFILEASMGTGKTETALVAAEVLAARHGCHGLVFALPTRASANAIFARFLDWMEALPTSTLSLSAPVYLAHGRARLNSRYLDVTSVRGVSEDDPRESRAMPRIFANRKTTPLAPMTVGTVDHVLQAGLDAKHQPLRHIGFIGKVIVIDEVHAYDAYMSTVLESALRWFGAYGVPVILLSATLPPAKRRSLIAAYSGIDDEQVEGAEGYPLLTVASQRGIRTHSFPSPRESVPYRVEHVADDVDEIVALARAHSAQGANVLIIRNTVRRAVATWEATEGDSDLLLHSRFLPADRERIESELLARFGTRVRDKEARGIVVSTQVAEQSLDIDFDVLITDLAPIDLILQRTGRVFRNPSAPRAVAEATLAIIDLDVTERTSLPYDTWTLGASRRLLGGRDQVTTPEDVPWLVASGYDPRIDSEGYARVEEQERASSRKASARNLPAPDRADSFGAWGNERSEDLVRDIDSQQDVVLLFASDDGKACIAPWFLAQLHPGTPVVSLRNPHSVYQAVAASTMSVPEYLLARGYQSADIPEETVELMRLRDDTKVLLFSLDGEGAWRSGSLCYSVERGLDVR